jgi:hypothetical protein
MSLAPPFIQAFTLSEPYISALVQSKTAGYRNAKDAKIMEDKFVFLWTLSPAVDIVGGVKTPKAYYFN